MRMMRFSALYLLSIREKRGLSVKFSPAVTVLQAKNGYGKSAVTKSLYDAFGATPHKIDKSWKSANVITLLEFSIDDSIYRILKSASRFTIFDASGHTLLDTSAITSELAPFLAEMFDFKLLMTDRDGTSVVPPPAYIFAPFYVDQDRSWSTPWQSFDRMYLPNSAKSLSEYHTGLRPNAYYECRARRDRLQASLNTIQEQREAVTRALAELREISRGSPLNFSLDDFTAEVEDLVQRSNELGSLQASYRTALSDLENERALWIDQQDILRRSVVEIRDTIHIAARQPESVECPTCGQHYDNSVAEQFGLAANLDDLFEAYQSGRDRVVDLDEQIRKQRATLNIVESKLREIEVILAQAREDTTLDDVIVARGRTETAEALRRRIGEVDEALGRALFELKNAEAELRRTTDAKRSERINSYFNERYLEFATRLDVRTASAPQGVLTKGLARGSEGPRGLISYYYSILHTEREYGSSVYCPIVVDAPNQQGQDSEHLPAILRFLAAERPADAQVIIASEEGFGLEETGAKVVSVGAQKNQVLQESQYQAVADYVRPFLGQLL